MKKILSIVILVFLLTGCQLQMDTKDTSESISQDTIDEIKQQVLTELSQEILNQNSNIINETEEAIVNVVKAKSSSVLGVSNFKLNDNTLTEVGTGSGVIYKSEGDSFYLVTNHHVIEDADEIRVVLPDREYIDATLIGSDAVTDLAVVTFNYDGFLPSVEFANVEDLIIGQFVIAVGNPLGYEYYRSISLGILSGLPEDMYHENSEWDILIQHDAAINPGNSGGALFDIKGNLIGINNMKIVQEEVNGIGFAIPSNIVIDIIDKLEQDGNIVRPELGISGGEVDQLRDGGFVSIPSDITYGIYISEVRESTGAYQAGLQVADVIIEADGIEIIAFDDLKSLINQKNVGDVIVIIVNRNGSILSFNVTLTQK